MNNQTINNQLILVLKDAHKDLSQLLNTLQLAQYMILVVQNRQDYLNQIKFTRPSFIILDLLMTDADGWQICVQLQNDLDTDFIPLVLLNSSVQTAAKIAELGWQNIDCIAETREPEKIVHLIKTRLSAKTRDLATPTSDNRDRQLILANYQLQTANRDLLNLNRDLEHFASLVSHDLQAPLRSLTMFSELLIDEYHHELDPQARKYLERISNSSLKMQALIEDLLAYSRAGKSKQTWIVVDLNQTLQQVQENLYSAIASKQAQINVSNLPKILINPTEIQQLFQNLLENAIKFSDCQSPQIEVRAVQREREWLISITDNGIGIAAEFQSEIFQVFRRLNSAEAYPGTGMGLAICQKIVERYGGKIWVESSLGEGSTFHFTLPLDIYPQSLAVNS